MRRRPPAVLAALLVLALGSSTVHAESIAAGVTRLAKGLDGELRRAGMKSVRVTTVGPGANLVEAERALAAVLQRAGVQVVAEGGDGVVALQLLASRIAGTTSAAIALSREGKVVYSSRTTVNGGLPDAVRGFGPDRRGMNQGFQPYPRTNGFSNPSAARFNPAYPVPGANPNFPTRGLPPSDQFPSEPYRSRPDDPAPSPPEVDHSPLLLRTSAYRNPAVSRNYVVLPGEGSKSTRAADPFGLRVKPFEEPRTPGVVGRTAVPRSGELVAIWIATRLDEAGFRTTVETEGNEARLRTALPATLIAGERASVEFVVSGTAEMFVAMQSKGPSVEATASLAATVDVRLGDAPRSIYSKSFRPNAVTRTGTNAERAKARAEALTALLDDFTTAFLADAKLGELLPASVPVAP